MKSDIPKSRETPTIVRGDGAIAKMRLSMMSRDKEKKSGLMLP